MTVSKPSRYILRFFFDGATGNCLWAGNAETAGAFDYPVNLEMLKLPDDVLVFGNQVIDQWTRYSDRGDTEGKEQDFADFQRQANRLLTMLREHLGVEFEILDEWFGQDIKIVSGG